MSFNSRILPAVTGALVLSIAAGLAGCTGTTRTGTEYTLQLDRKLTGFVNADLATTHETALSVLAHDFAFDLVDERSDAREGIVAAMSAKNRQVVVETYARGDQTKIEVFVGPAGDLDAEIEIFSALEYYLGG
jgi:hypothetical protein